MRKSIALLELVIAIVVISIALLSVPLIIEQSSKGIELSHQYHPVNVAKKKISEIMSMYWDEKNELYKNVLEVNSSQGLECDSEHYRKGHVKINGRRQCDAVSASLVFADSTLNDVDDYNNTSYSFDTDTLKTDMSVGVRYIDFDCQYGIKTLCKIDAQDNNSTSTNVKLIEISSTLRGSNIAIKLFATRSNIGEYDYLHKRDIP